MLRKFKKLLKPLEATPFHPQWLCRDSIKGINDLLKQINRSDIVLDIGCSDKWVQRIIPQSCTYIGIDYLNTALNLYHTSPDTYGDACCLPIKSNSVDTVLLLDVIEHLPDPYTAIREIRRVLVKSGSLIMKLPFLYPLHDEPYDFVRLTKHGICNLAKELDLVIINIQQFGVPIQTSGLLMNLALVKTISDWIISKHVASIFILFLPVCIVVINLLAKLAMYFCRRSDMMPYSYHVVLKK